MTRAGGQRRGRRDAGSAPVEFTLVAPLVIAWCLAVGQVGLWVIARSDAAAAAFAGARSGAVVPGSDAARARVAAAETAGRLELPPGTDRVSAAVASEAGVRSVRVEVAVPLTLVGWRLPVRTTVSSHVPVEPG